MQYDCFRDENSNWQHHLQVELCCRQFQRQSIVRKDLQVSWSLTIDYEYRRFQARDDVHIS